MIFERRIPFFLISRHLRRANRWTLGLVIFLMSVAFVNLVFVNSLFNGVIRTSNQQVIDLNGNITVTPERGQEFISDTPAVVKTIEETPGVQAASARVLVPGVYTFGNVQNSYQTVAVDPEQEADATVVSQRMIAGSYLSPTATDQIILGKLVAGGKGVLMNATSLQGARVGDSVTLTLGDVSRSFKVVGIFYVKSVEEDRQAFISNRSLDLQAPAYSSKATSIVVKTEKKGDERQVIRRLKAKGVPGTFTTWKEQAGQASSVNSTFVTINALLTTVGFIIAAVVIFIIIYVDVSTRRRQIGILRAIGIKPNIVISTYVLQSTVYSVLGVLLGSVLYFVIIVTYFKVHPFKLPLGDVRLSVDYIDYLVRGAAVIIVSILSGLIPSILATRGNILDEIHGR
jgi:putative ABC transport system permease protein